MSETSLPAKRSSVARRANIPAPLTATDVEGMGVDELTRQGALLVRAYAQVEHVGTEILKSLAEVLWALRLRHDDPRGRSQTYRLAAGELYRQAGIGPDTADRTQANVRWHVGNLMRDRLSASELEELDLRPTGPRERMTERRSLTTAVLVSHRAATTAAEVDAPIDGAPVGKLVADHLRLGASVTNILNRMNASTITEDMTPGQRAALDEHYAAAQERLRELRALVKQAGKK